MRLLLVAGKGRARDRYIEELALLETECDVASTPGELLRATRNAPYSGVLFDVPTILREKTFDKKFLRSLAEVYPSAKIKHDTATDTVCALGTEAASATEGGLSVFVAACRDFLPRSLRQGERIDAHLPAVLWRTPPDGSNAGERTCTTNISFLGCFLFTTATWTASETAWVEFPDVTPQPIRARVAWFEPWGRRRAIPGIGLAFLDIPEVFFEEMRRLGCQPVDFDIASSPKGL
jgi:hypothetical protein